MVFECVEHCHYSPWTYHNYKNFHECIFR